MKNSWFYIFLILLLTACANVEHDYMPNTTQQEKAVANTEAIEEPKAVKEEKMKSDSELLTAIIGNKLQEVYDLIDLINDKGLPLEMRTEAEIMLHKLVQHNVIYDSIKEHKVSDIVLVIDSLPNYTVAYKIANTPKKAQVYVNISKAIVEGEVVANYEVIVKKMD